MQALNQRLFALFGAEAQLGQSYFMGINEISELAKRLYRQIIPQIIEYIKLSAVPAQIPGLLAQVLYGELALNDGLTSNNSLSLLQTNVASNGQESQWSPAIQGQASAPIGLNPDFIAAATVGNMEAENLYLTAKPYKLLYTRYLSAQE